jgi:hypothetical protein
MAKAKQQQFHSKHTDKRQSSNGRLRRREVRERTSLAQSIGKIYKAQARSNNPSYAIQQIHLMKKQREFLVKEAEVFDRRSKTIQAEVKEINEKIKLQRSIVQDMVRDIDLDNIDEQKPQTAKRTVRPKVGSRPAKTIGQKAKNFFRLGY